MGDFARHPSQFRPDENATLLHQDGLNIVDHVDDLVTGDFPQRQEKIVQHVAVVKRAFQHVIVAPGRAVVVAEIVVVTLDQFQIVRMLAVLNGDLNENLAWSGNLVEIDFNGVFRNHAGIFQPLDASGYSWGGEVDEVGQVASFDATIAIKFLDNGNIGFVWHIKHLIF